MIARWPDHYPDELLYSVVARCRHLLGIQTHRCLPRALFGSKNAPAKIDLPNRLGYLSKKIPGVLHRQPDRIARELTLLNLYVPFLRPEHSKRLKKAMLTDGGPTGISPLKVHRPGQLQFCPQCWERDLAAYGETYWRRSHQAPGSLVCHLHGDSLHESPVSCAFNKTIQEFATADSILLDQSVALSIPGDNRPFLRALAENIHWLLNENTYVPGAALLNDGYMTALQERGFTQGTYSQSVRNRPLKELILEKVGQINLQKLGSGIEISRDFDWVTQLLRPSQTSRASQSPVRHLILMYALDHTASSFFKAMQTPRTHTLVISPKTEVDLKTLKTWWSDPLISINEIGRRLRMNCDKVKVIAAKLELAIPRFGKWGNAAARTGNIHEDLLQYQREAFLYLLKSKPGLGLMSLAKINMRLVKWLRRNDRGWLDIHAPARIQGGGAPSLDWVARDDTIAARIPGIAAKLRLSMSKISVRAIEQELQFKFGSTRKKLPKTDLLLRQESKKVKPKFAKS